MFPRPDRLLIGSCNAALSLGVTLFGRMRTTCPAMLIGLIPRFRCLLCLRLVPLDCPGAAFGIFLSKLHYLGIWRLRQF